MAWAYGSLQGVAPVVRRVHQKIQRHFKYGIDFTGIGRDGIVGL